MLCWFASPTVANAESWILWESVEERRPRPIDTPFPSQAACVSRGQARIVEYRKQVKPPNQSTLADGGLTLRVRWQVPTNTRDSIEMLMKYKKSTEPLLSMYEKESQRKTEELEVGEADFSRGIMGESELRARKRAAAAAQKNVDDTRRDIAKIDEQIAKANRQPATEWIAVTPLSYQCWPVGVNP